ncbi:MAG TPA: hypothetical protein DIT95_01635, partial [Arenibacter sp.]|nr:hypothetical protein [Arenibacter sp.]
VKRTIYNPRSVIQTVPTSQTKSITTHVFG